jgi:hypothetical protein
MHAITRAFCRVIFGMGLVSALAQPADEAFGQPAEEARKQLQGTWSAAKADRDGKGANDVVGHRLSFTGNRFLVRRPTT